MKLSFQIALQIALVLIFLLFIKDQLFAQQILIPHIRNQTNSNPVRSQKALPCKLDLSQVPAVQGIKFGMSKEELENYFGIRFIGNTLSTEDNQIGLSNLGFYRVLVNKYPQQLDGVEIIQLRLFENKLYSYSVSFDHSKNWSNTEQFTSYLSESLNLPKDWETSGSSAARMNCQGFRVEANTYFLPEVSLTNLTTLQEIEVKRTRFRDRVPDKVVMRNAPA